MIAASVSDGMHCVLVVDDDQLLNGLLCEFLHSKELATYSVFSFSDAKHELIKNPKIDLVLLDYDLGDGTGLELLRQLYPVVNHTLPPVIMISVNEDPEFLQSCFACGIVDFIIKPINFSLLALKIRAQIKSVSMQKLISLQHAELARFKRNAEQEEAIAKFTYEYFIGKNSETVDGVNTLVQPCSSFSGDIAMVRTSANGDLYFMLADATGHGLSAAITIMPVVTIFNAMVAKGFDIKHIVTELNKKLNRDTPPDRFVAAVIVQIQKKQGELHIWNGGMPMVIWVNSGEIQQSFCSRHMALGILDNENFDSSIEMYRFSHSGFLFACTDGLLEETNAKGECFSMQRVTEVIESKPVNLHQQLMVALRAYTGHATYSDDVSLCTLTPSEM